VPLAREHLLVGAALFVPVLCAYLGVKSAVRLALAARRGHAREMASRERVSLGVLAAVNAFFLGLYLYGWLIESNAVALTRHVVAVGASAPAPPLRIVHISDLHAEGFGRREERALALVREAAPDLVVLTGDYTSDERNLAHVASARRFVSSLGAPFGVFAVPGNWDTDLRRVFDGTGVRVLQDEGVELNVRGVRVFVFGCRFASAPPSRGLAGSDVLEILLHHSPDYLEEAAGAGFDLYLCGHTHGGQVRVPGYGAIVTLSRFGKRYESGPFALGPTQMYVNRGLGLEGGWAPRIRLFCPPEVAAFEITSGASATRRSAAQAAPAPAGAASSRPASRGNRRGRARPGAGAPRSRGSWRSADAARGGVG
jgi:hypothetical protein